MPSAGNSTLSGLVSSKWRRPMTTWLPSAMPAPSWSFADEVAGRLVPPQAFEAGVPQLAVPGPLGERHFGHQLGTHPVHAPLGDLAPGERRPVDLKRIEPGAQVEQRGP